MNELGMGMTDTEIKFERAESLSDRLYGLVSFFMESGADARGYHFTQNDLLVVDSNMVKIDHLKKLSVRADIQDPCGELRSGPSYRAINPELYESVDGDGNYKFYTIAAGGKVENLHTDRKYGFTKFVQIDKSYFKTCRYEGLPHEPENEGSANVVYSEGAISVN